MAQLPKRFTNTLNKIDNGLRATPSVSLWETISPLTVQLLKKFTNTINKVDNGLRDMLLENPWATTSPLMDQLPKRFTNMLNKSLERELDSPRDMVIERTSESLSESLDQKNSSKLAMFNLRIQLPGKVLVLLSHQSHQFQDLSPLLPLLLETSTRRELTERRLLLMPKNPRNSPMRLLRRLKLDFHTPLLCSKLKTQLPGKELESLSHLSHQFQDLSLLLLPLLVTLTRRELMVKQPSLMLKNQRNSLTRLLRRLKPDSHTPLPSYNLRTQLPGKELELHSHLSHQFQDSLPPLPILLLTLT